MKELFRKSVAATVAAMAGLAPIATQLSAAVATRTGVAAASGALVLLAPTAAQAQSGKRICATVWGAGVRGGGGSGLASIGMKVNKYDLVTCGLTLTTWVSVTSLPAGFQAFAKAVFNNAAGVGFGLMGSPRYNQTCEAFSSSMQSSRGNVCLSMSDYRLYTFVKVWGGPFAMGKT